MSSRGIPVDTSYGLTPPPTSSKHRKAEAAAEKAAAAAAAAEAAAAEAARLAELRRRYDQPQPKSVTCALCKKSETVGDAIAHEWKKHPLGFTTQAICAECYVPSPSSPTFVYVPDGHNKHGGTRRTKSKSKRSKSKRSRSRSKSRSRSRAHRSK